MMSKSETIHMPYHHDTTAKAFYDSMAQEWNRLMEVLAPTSQDIAKKEMFEEIFFFQSMENRYYHTMHHVHSMLFQAGMYNSSHIRPEAIREYNEASHAQNKRNEKFHFDELLFAIWHHDLIYDPFAKDNEEQSAVIAKRACNFLKISDEATSRIYNMIIATKHIGTTNTLDEKVICDTDLAILGSSWNEFSHYEKNIRKEYSGVTDTDFRKGRTKVLQSFLSRDRIYYTDFFSEMYESNARMNLEHSIALLQNPSN